MTDNDSVDEEAIQEADATLEKLEETQYTDELHEGLIIEKFSGATLVSFLKDLFAKRKRLHCTPTILQTQTTECGAVCLAILMGYYGKNVPRQELCDKCGVSRDGTSFYGITQAAKFHGMQADVYEVDAADLHTLELPAIIYLGAVHLVVLESIYAEECAFINDPAAGPSKISWGKFVKKYQGIAITVAPGEGFQPGGMVIPFWKQALHAIAPYKGTIAFLIILQFFLVLLGLTTPLLMSLFIDNMLSQQLGVWGLPLMAGFAGLLTVLFVLLLMKENTLTRLRTKIAGLASTNYLQRLLKYPIAFFFTRERHTLASVELYATIYSDLIEKNAVALLNIAFLFLYGIVITYFNVIIGTIGFVVTLLNLMVWTLVNPSRITAMELRNHDLALVFFQTVGFLSNMENVKLSASKNFAFSHLAGPQTAQLNAFQKISGKDIWLFSFTAALQQIGNVSLLLVGASAVMTGNTSVGIIVGLQFLMNRFLEPMTTIDHFGGMFIEQKKALSAANDAFNQTIDPGFLNPEKSLEISHEKIPPLLEMKHITFGYNPLEDPLLNDLSLTVSPQNIVGIVGHTGSGKSTIAQLATGLIPLWKGEILYGGKPMNFYTKEQVARSLAVVSQNFFIFEGSLYDNLTLWDPRVPEEHVLKALEGACILREVLALNKGIHAHLKKDGINLSRGQRQRLMIARALLWNPTILILDEATSTLDNELEQELFQKLHARECAIMIITHRLSVITQCDEILVINEGTPIERGSLDELTRLNGVFSELLKKQAFT